MTPRNPSGGWSGCGASGHRAAERDAPAAQDARRPICHHARPCHCHSGGRVERALRPSGARRACARRPRAAGACRSKPHAAQRTLHTTLTPPECRPVLQVSVLLAWVKCRADESRNQHRAERDKVACPLCMHRARARSRILARPRARTHALARLGADLRTPTHTHSNTVRPHAHTLTHMRTQAPPICTFPLCGKSLESLAPASRVQVRIARTESEGASERARERDRSCVCTHAW